LQNRLENARLWQNRIVSKTPFGDFLAFLLDLRQNHGLGDEFTRLLLQKALLNADGSTLPISLIDLAKVQK
jgi:hypothetical protein